LGWESRIVGLLSVRYDALVPKSTAGCWELGDLGCICSFYVAQLAFVRVGLMVIGVSGRHCVLKSVCFEVMVRDEHIAWLRRGSA
jgi:hypothetical protein